MSEVNLNSSSTVGESSTSNGSSVLIPEDTSHIQISTIKFDGNNYITWSKLIHIFVQGRGKEEYLTNEVEIPPRIDPRYKKWKTENAIVMGWLLGSMKPKISEHYLFLETAHQILKTLTKAYYEMGHAAKVYDLRQRIAQFKQGDLPVTIYYSAFRKMWKKLDIIQHIALHVQWMQLLTINMLRRSNCLSF